MIALLLALCRFACHLTGRRFGRWIRTSTGRRFYPLDPRPKDVSIEDIARGLANICRYNGQLRSIGVHYSVAEHSVLVSRAAWDRRGRSAAQIGLLHDAAEAYIADIARPVKRSWLLAGYRAAEDHLHRVILQAFKISRQEARDHAKLIRALDTRILADEMPRLMRGADTSGLGPPIDAEIRCYAPHEAEGFFLREARWLGLA